MLARNAKLTADPLDRQPGSAIGGQELVGEVEIGGGARDARHHSGFHHRQQIRQPNLNGRIAHRTSPSRDE